MGKDPLSSARGGSLGREAILCKSEEKKKGGGRWREVKKGERCEHHCCGFTGEGARVVGMTRCALEKKQTTEHQCWGTDK